MSKAPTPIPVPPVAPVVPPVVAPAVDTATKTDRVAPTVTAIATGITLPERTSKPGNKSIYPFEALPPGGMFGVENKTKVNLGSVITNQNRKYLVKKTDDAGNVVYKTTAINDASGAEVGRTPTTEAEMVPSRHFVAIDVDADVMAAIVGTALEGSTVIVKRDI